MLRWQDMITGGREALMLLVVTISVAITIAVISFVGLFIGGSLEQAGDNLSFTTEASNSSIQTPIGDAFNQTTQNLITNLNAVQTPFATWTNLLIVILVLAVFGGLIYLGYRAYKGGKGGSGGEMGY